MKNFDSIEEALNVDTEVVEDNKIQPRKNQLKKSDQNDSEKVTTFKVSATTDLAANQRIIIDTEIMKIRSISGQNVTVFRAHDNTIAAKHEHNARIGVLSSTDNASIEFGDDFGFDEMSSFFSDGKEFSPSQGIDI